MLFIILLLLIIIGLLTVIISKLPKLPKRDIAQEAIDRYEMERAKVNGQLINDNKD